MEPDYIEQTITQPLRTPLTNDRYIFVTQIIVRPIIFLIRLCLGRRIVVDLKPTDIISKYRYIIVANHGSWFDPLVIMYSFPIRTFIKLGPFRVMVLNKLFDSILRPIIVPLGSFPAKPHIKYRYGIDQAQDFVTRGVTLGIFPEGRRNLDGKVQPKRGIAELAAGQDVRIIPVHIEWRRRLLGLVPMYRIRIGKPQPAQGLTAKQIMERVYTLPLS